MTDPVLMLVEYGGYLSIVKLCSFLLFFPSWALINWTYKDAKSIDANEVMWTAIMLGTLVVTVLLWFMVPIYTVGLVLYLVGMLGTGLAYVKYRNARVLDFDKVLTRRTRDRRISPSSPPTRTKFPDPSPGRPTSSATGQPMTSSWRR